MRIRVSNWRKLNRGQKYIMILIAYGYWQGRWETRKKVKGGEKVALRKPFDV